MARLPVVARGSRSTPSVASLRSPRWRYARRTGLALGVVLLILAAWIVVPAIGQPGNDGLSARIAESARDKGFGFVVTGLEAVQYRLSPPKTGGSLDAADSRSLAADAPPSRGRGSGSPGPGHPLVTLQPPLDPLASPALPGEGVFAARVTVDGQPAVQTALLRPDDVHTSYLAGVAWMSSHLLRFEQHPGSADPGRLARWDQPPTIPPARRAGLVATFNSGFKIADARGGFYQDGHTSGTLRPRAASFVVYADGHVDIGSWGSEVRMTPQVRSVRQNLGLLIDDGRLSPRIDSDTQSTWGATLGAASYVWRSGVGVTAAGDVVFAVGPALSARTLAGLLQRAGAVRAMELDINPEWVSYMWYSQPSSGAPLPHKLLDFARPADRYFTVNSRDFFAVYSR